LAEEDAKPMENASFFDSGTGTGRTVFSFASFSGIPTGAAVKRSLKTTAAPRTISDNAKKRNSGGK